MTDKNSYYRAVVKRMMRNKSAVIGLVVFSILVLLAVFAPLVSPYDYTQMDMMNKFARPSTEHWLGTDELGRDILGRILYGGRYSLSIGILVVGLSTVVGAFFGAIAGFFGGKVDSVIMRIMDIFQSIPGLLLNIAMSAVLGTGFGMTVLALAISRTPGPCRLLRAQFMTVRQQEYVEAAQSMSVSRTRIILKHILPNAWSPLIVSSTMAMASSILTASSLSFIGLGIQPPTPEWGAMLSSGRQYFRDYPHIVMAPGVFIMITVLALNMFGDALRDAMDPKLKD